jgi:hypothetical protein
MLAHEDRTRVLADEHRGAVVTKNLRVKATFMWDGFVQGTWDVERRRNAAVLHVRPFASLPRAATTALTQEAERLLRFIEEDATSFEIEIVKP